MLDQLSLLTPVFSINFYVAHYIEFSFTSQSDHSYATKSMISLNPEYGRPFTAPTPTPEPVAQNHTCGYYVPGIIEVFV